MDHEVRGSDLETPEGEQAATPEALIERLSQTVRRIDQDDLSGLAKMHGWCQALAERCAETGDTSGALSARARALLGQLEALILGEVEDAGQAFAAVAAAVSELAGSAAPDSAGREEVEAKLARVFDEQPVAAQTPDAAKAGSGAATDQGQPAGSQAYEPYEQLPLTLKPEDLEFIKGFVEESREHVEAIEAAVLEVEAAPDDTAKINDLFRPFHTIKGMAGFLNLRDIQCLTHEVETLLDQGRKGQRQITSGLIDLIFEVVDILKVQIASLSEWVASPQGDVVPQPPVVEMIERLRAVISGQVEPEPRQPAVGSAALKTGENLVEQGAVPQAVVDFALQRQQAGGRAKKLGQVLVDMRAATPKQVSQAIRAQVQPRREAAEGAAPAAGTRRTVGEQTIRIDTAKLDLLVDWVGELVIAQSLVSASPQVTADTKLAKDVSLISKIVREVQEVAMAMRMVPIGPTFQKMARLVRDVARKAGKQVNLTISGEDTELDKTVIQHIHDPLVHMVRNAVDHGIESPAERRAAGKPECGQIHLAASHQGGNIVIEISDDGKGLDADALVVKAIEKGLIGPDEELNEQQAYALIFAPGFSTATQVTDISGRGVGMDVVRRNIEQLRGKVEISSKKGHGATFAIHLPLTLAIIDGMIIRVGGERFIIPTIAVEQFMRPRAEQISIVQQRGEILNVRGRLVPLVQLGELFDLTGRIAPWEAMVVIARCEEGQIGLVVEELIGQQQVVIKPLGERFRHVRGISGAAILGDGRVGLILEMSGLAAAHAEQVAVRHSAGPASDTARDQPPEPSGSSPAVPEPATVH